MSETVIMCTHGGQRQHPWEPGEWCPVAAPRTPAPALTPEEACTVARFDAAPVPPEVVAAGELVEAVARALSRPGDFWVDCLSRARDAIAALPSSPAELVLQRVEALHHPVPGDYGDQVCATCMNAVEERMEWPCPTGAALASPAPAPQGDVPDYELGPEIEDAGPRGGF